ncbi:MAG TPA: hypothetical protein VD969_19665 [Symbiobacteriaceae bacterium]|nr:hypothetical protein [Symbiobacteriaceae bacterium]
MFGPKPLGLTVKVAAVNRRAAAAVLMDIARELLSGDLTTYGVRTDPSADATHKVEHGGSLTAIGVEAERELRRA